MMIFPRLGCKGRNLSLATNRDGIATKPLDYRENRDGGEDHLSSVAANLPNSHCLIPKNMELLICRRHEWTPHKTRSICSSKRLVADIPYL
jgi:hypothetical protein